LLSGLRLHGLLLLLCCGGLLLSAHLSSVVRCCYPTATTAVPTIALRRILRLIIPGMCFSSALGLVGERGFELVHRGVDVAGGEVAGRPAELWDLRLMPRSAITGARCS
jgi:hypothetical protein